MFFFNQRPLFHNRTDAGRLLAKQLLTYQKENPLILALPRGGVVVGYEVAKALHAPLDVLISRKIGAPHNPEFGIGAVSEDNTVILDEKTIAMFGYATADVERITKEDKKEVARRIKLYRNNRPLPNLSGKTVILIDDGVVTGVTARAAIEAVQKKKPNHIIFAVPVCALETAQILRLQTDAVICSHSSQDVTAIGMYYEDFRQVSDEEVIRLLAESKKLTIQQTPA